MSSPSTSADRPRCEVKVISSPFHRYLERIQVTVDRNNKDILEFIRESRSTLYEQLQDRLDSLGAIKFWLCVSASYHKSSDEEIKHKGFFQNVPKTLLHDVDIEQCLDESFCEVAKDLENFEEKGSDWVLESVNHIDLYTAAYTPLRASSYSPLPSFIQRKHAIINVKNRDNRCFMWCILAALHPVPKNAERVSKYRQFEDTLTFEGIDFPVQLQDIPKFTELNEISVNVFACDDRCIYPIHRTKKKLTNHVNLMYYDGHYSYIRNLDALLGDQNAHKAKGFYCDMCLFPMNDAERLAAHSCDTASLAKIQMPSDEDKWLKFKNFHKMQRKPTVVYADFEAILNPFYGCERPPNSQIRTEKYQQHVPCSFGMVVSKSCCGDPTFEDLQIRTAEDPAAIFLDELVKLAEKESATDGKPLNMRREDEIKFHEEENCRICNLKLGNDRVRDHCHTCGKYRSALHAHCNRMLRLDREIVVVMHNMKRYDTHIIMQSIGQACTKNKLKLSCVAKGMENYVTFSLDPANPSSKWKIRFVDSAQFLAGSLEQLIKQVPTEQLSAMRAYFHEDQIALLGRKGVFCYDYLDSWDKMSVEHPISKDKFYNKLNGAHISQEDYEHYLDVCRMLNITDLRHYMELYLKMDVLQLADVFEEFRKFSLENYQLDPCHYSTLPGLAWDACLKMTGVTLELLTDPEMFTFIEKGIRGGISVISKRKAEANNQYLASWFEDAVQSFILYLDANNLYGWSMKEMLPMSEFRWLTQEEIDRLIVPWLNPEGDIGFILEVDLEYPEHIHDKHNSYPLAPESIEITKDMLSSYSRDIGERHGLKLDPVKKLAPNLRNKEKYVVHYRNLQFYLSQGLVLRKIHRVLCFKQGRWMAPYIDFNTERRKAAKTELDKNLYKFYINAVFGKTMENVRKYKQVELVTNRTRFLKVTKKPTFQRCCIFTEDLVGCEVGRSCIELNKPIYVGFTVLDLSKLLMFNFHYNFVLPKFGLSAELLLTDTDSLIYHITSVCDIYRCMLDNMDQFDTSDYPVTHFLHSLVNKKIVGKMKDELNGKPAKKFIGLRPKMYSISTEDDEKKRAKGVKRKIVENEITHQDYDRTLTDRSYMIHDMRSIRSEKHVLYSICQSKKSLSCFDDKLFILDDGINTLAYGHYRIRDAQDSV